MASTWSQTINVFLKSHYVSSMIGGLVVGGVYVTYKDNTRYSKITHVFHAGCILPPFKENNYEVRFVSRKKLEEKLKDILSVNFTKQFYVISGQIGTGKSRLVMEMTRDLISDHMKRETSNDETQTDADDDHRIGGVRLIKCGAPIYVSAAQGSVFADTLAQAIDFNFDEHISLPAFLDSVLGISTIGKRESGSGRLSRVLNAIEISACLSSKKYKSPVVIVIDSVEQLPDTDLSLLFTKAKFWADQNLVKIVFVTNNRKINELLHLEPSNLARANFSLVFGDLKKDEVLYFLQNSNFMETDNAHEGHFDPALSEEVALEVYDLVGGRISQLVRVKRLWVEGYCWEDIKTILKNREMEKFVHLSRQPKAWLAISLLRRSPNKTMLYSKLIKQTSVETLNLLERQNIITLKYRPQGVVVTFESKIIKVLVDETERAWEAQKLQVEMESSQLAAN